MVFLAIIMMFSSDGISQNQFEIFGSDYQEKSDKASSLQERLLLFTDNDVYVNGQSIQVSLINLDINNNYFNASKVAYVELVDGNRQPVEQKIVPLKNARGQCSFFLPSYLKTGNYSIIAYTNWMKNYSNDIIPVKTLSIFNPFVASDARDESIKREPKVVARCMGQINDYNGEQSLIYWIGLMNIYNQFESFKGKLVDGSGVVQVEFEPNNNGLANIIVKKPKYPLTSTKLILSDSLNNIYYHDLPILDVQKKALSVLLHEDEDQYQLDVVVGFEQVDRIREEQFIVILNNQPRPELPKVANDGKYTFTIDKNILKQGKNEFSIIRPSYAQQFSGWLYKSDNKSLDIILESDELENRSKGSFSLLSEDSLIEYTVSIRKTGELDRIRSNPYSAYNYFDTFSLNSNHLLTDLEISQLLMFEDSLSERTVSKTALDRNIHFLPEIHGKLISGNIDLPETTDRKDHISLTIVDQEYTYLSCKPDDQGKFYFDVPIKEFEKGIIDYSSYPGAKISLDDDFISDRSFLHRSNLLYDSAIAIDLNQRSIAAQLNNAYFFPGKDSVSNSKDALSEESNILILDEYTRFPTMEDVLIEIVPNLQVRKKDTDFSLRFSYLENGYVPIEPPLILLDGVNITSAEMLMKIDPLKLYAIEEKKARYVRGTFKGDGLIHLKSYNADPLELIDLQEAHQLSLSIAAKQDFGRSNFSRSTLDPREPDYRLSLLWVSTSAETSLSEQKFEFHTSDVKGEFVIDVIGLKKDGSLIQQKKYFTVKSNEF